MEDFFNRPTVTVARDLIGCYLVRKRGDQIERYIIIETEAYDGPKDLACHAAKGRTTRTEVMFGPPGRWYVYFIYGIHWMLNVVTGPEGYPSAVLIRGLEEVSGPARLTKKLGITGVLHGKEASEENGLWIEISEKKISPRKIERTPRIGIEYAGPVWSQKKWRFVLKASKK